MLFAILFIATLLLVFSAFGAVFSWTIWRASIRPPRDTHITPLHAK